MAWLHHAGRTMTQKCVVSTIILAIFLNRVAELLNTSITLSCLDDNMANISVPSLIYALKHSANENDQDNTRNMARQESPYPEFSWGDIDYSSKGNCGHYKCFFRCSTDPQTGYLVTRTNNDSFKAQLRGWEVAKDIETKYNARHFYLTRPIIVKANSTITTRLNANLKLPPDVKRKQNFFGGLALAVHKVRIAPSDTVLVGCNRRKVRPTLMAISKKLDKTNLAMVTDTFEKEITDLTHLLQAESFLVWDFQVWVDSQGKLYHFDLDRGANQPPPKDSDIKICTCNLRKLAVLLSSHENIKNNATPTSYQELASKIFSPKVSKEKKFYLLNDNELFGNLSECQTNRFNASTTG
jgi:hypothetical protein